MAPWFFGYLGAAGGAGAGAFDLLETTELTSAASSITFSGLSSYSDYKHLQIRIIARGDSNFHSEDLALRVNGNTWSPQYSHRLFAQDSSQSSSSYTGTYYKVGFTVGAAGGNTNQLAPSIIDILNWNAYQNHTIRSLSGAVALNATYENKIGINSALQTGQYDRESISSLTFFNSGGGSLDSKTRISIYGVK